MAPGGSSSQFILTKEKPEERDRRPDRSCSQPRRCLWAPRSGGRLVSTHSWEPGPQSLCERTRPRGSSHFRELRTESRLLLSPTTVELQAARRQQHTQGFLSACDSARHPLSRTTVFQACAHRHRMPFPFYSQYFLCNIHRSCVVFACPFATCSDSVLALLGMRISEL